MALAVQANRISDQATREWIGKAEDDDIEVETPKGKRAYSVKKLATIHTLMTSENGAPKE